MIEHHRVETNGITLHVAQAGPVDGPLVVLLHGFPEFWYGWRRRIESLAARGFRVWAPDQRGYDLSDKPSGVARYTIDILVRDIVGLLDAAGARMVGIVGHDWGGAVAWQVAVAHPDRVRRLVILNAPHPDTLMRRLLRDPRQLARSWYVFFFQLPWLPELFSRLGNWRLVTRALTTTSRRGTFTPHELDVYRAAWARPGAFSAMINWYRAAWRRGSRTGHGKIRVPTLVIWGDRDAFLGRELAADGIARCETGRVEYIEGASHWVQHEEPERVNALLAEWLA